MTEETFIQKIEDLLKQYKDGAIQAFVVVDSLSNNLEVIVYQDWYSEQVREYNNFLMGNKI